MHDCDDVDDDDALVYEDEDDVAHLDHHDNADDSGGVDMDYSDDATHEYLHSWVVGNTFSQLQDLRVVFVLEVVCDFGMMSIVVLVETTMDGDTRGLIVETDGGESVEVVILNENGYFDDEEHSMPSSYDKGM